MYPKYFYLTITKSTTKDSINIQSESQGFNLYEILGFLELHKNTVINELEKSNLEAGNNDNDLINE